MTNSERLRGTWDAIRWWEFRRIVFNAVLAPIGLLATLVVIGVGSTLVPPGQDAVEPALLWVGTIAYAVAANIAYTLGWITELLWTGGDTSNIGGRRRAIFWIGLLLSALLTTTPALLTVLAWAFSRFAR